jgi:Ca-activated chloride channel family protein
VSGAWQAVFAHVAWPWLWLLLPLPWLLRRLLPPARSRGAALRLPGMASPEALATRGRRGRGAGWLAGLAWALLVLAASRPQSLGPAQQPPASGRGLFIALDLSGSMSEPDMDLGGRSVDRLTAAKAVLADFLDRRVGDRIGLIVFGERAYVLTPLTRDLKSVRAQLADSMVNLAGRSTAIGDAIALAVKRLSRLPKGERVLVLLTDGVSNAGVLDPLQAADLARKAGVRIHTIAFGGDGSTVSVFGMPITLPGGDDDVDEDTLRQISALTGGRMFRAHDADELAAIYREIDRLEPVAQAGPSWRPKIERYPRFLLAALGMAMLAWAWPRRTMRAWT